MKVEGKFHPKASSLIIASVNGSITAPFIEDHFYEFRFEGRLFVLFFP